MTNWISNLEPKRLAAGCLVLILVLTQAGCQSDESLKWTEDVLLPDGRTVTLTRYQEFKGPYEIGDSPSVSDYWFEFKHPDTGKTIRWEHDRTQATAYLMTHKQKTLLLTIAQFNGYQMHNCPNPPFFLFEYSDATASWERQPLETIPFKRVKPNMTSHPKMVRDLIRTHKHHLPTDASGADRIYGVEVWQINFEALTQQTFGTSNCSTSKGLSAVGGIQEK